MGDTVQYQMDRKGGVVAQLAVNHTGWSVDPLTQQSILALLMSRMNSFLEMALDSLSATRVKLSTTYSPDSFQ
jgi:hypothetical protein